MIATLLASKLFQPIAQALAALTFGLVIGATGANVYQHHFDFIVGFPNTHVFGVPLGAEFSGLGPKLEKLKLSTVDPVTGATYKDLSVRWEAKYNIVSTSYRTLLASSNTQSAALQKQSKEDALRLAAAESNANRTNVELAKALKQRGVVTSVSMASGDFCSRIINVDDAFKKGVLEQ